MDTKESVGKAAKGLGSLVLILLLMKGFTFSFRSNWLLTIGIIVGGTLFLYFVGLQFMEKEVGDNRRNFYRLLLCVYCQ